MKKLYDDNQAMLLNEYNKIRNTLYTILKMPLRIPSVGVES